MNKITVLSLVFLLMAGAAALYIIVNREAPVPLGFQVFHDPEVIEFPDGIVQNNYKIIIPNETPNHQKYILTLHRFSKGKIVMNGSWSEVDVKDLYVAKGHVGRWDVFIRAPKQKKASKKFSFRLVEVDTKRRGKYDSVFISRKVEDEHSDNSKK